MDSNQVSRGLQGSKWGSKSMPIVDDYAAIELRRLKSERRPEVSPVQHEGGVLRLERTFRLMPPSGHPSDHFVPGPEKELRMIRAPQRAKLSGLRRQTS
jgi:hypothetical protein